MSVHYRMARTWLAQAKYNSLVPFLYQTHTLRIIHPHAPRLKTHPCSSFSTSGSRPDEQQPQPESSDPHPSDSQYNRSNESESPGSAPTQRKSYLRKKSASVARHKKTQKSQTRKPSAESTISPSKRGSKSKTLSEPRLTTHETGVFAQLFKELGYDDNDLSKSGEDVASQDGQITRNSDKGEMEEISAIFNTVVKNMRKQMKKTESLDPLEEKPKLIDRPIWDNTNEDMSKRLAQNEMSPSTAVEAVVDREAAKIRAALQAALNEGQGETAVWNICKAKIFSMIQQLSLDDETAPMVHGLDTPRDEVDSQDPQSATSTSAIEPLDIPNGVSAQDVITKLYPQMLLAAFRLLNLHFPDSDLIEQYRSTISSLGRLSALIGTSTSLCNDMIYFYWRGCHDLPAVITLLRDMEVRGLEPDRRTCALLKSILRDRELDIQSVPGDASSQQNWWNHPVNAKALRELDGPDGWVRRLSRRLFLLEEREKSNPYRKMKRFTERDEGPAGPEDLGASDA
ncbi:hypothetical protein BJX61DRAFT_522587 [Aspergillus egyptiacus]|nr:hypothetical protein BJX61DRAFT_522587 [Aspergillus egyptiacus]